MKNVKMICAQLSGETGARLYLLKSHIPTYTKKDGTMVAAHSDKRVKRADSGSESRIWHDRVCVCIGDETKGVNRLTKKGWPNVGDSLSSVAEKLNIVPGQKMRVKVYDGKDLVSEYYFDPETHGHTTV